MTLHDALYHALILEHDRSPRNARPLPGATHTATLDNPLCGDIVTVHVRMSGEAPAQTITEATFEARSCALCRAAASMMTTRAIGLDTGHVAALVARFESFVAANNSANSVAAVAADVAPDAAPDVAPDADLGDLVAFRGVQAVRSRRTCATLPFRALAKALATRV
jgi:nitrogen fixation NifU-like protein